MNDFERMLFEFGRCMGDHGVEGEMRIAVSANSLNRLFAHMTPRFSNFSEFAGGRQEICIYTPTMTVRISATKEAA